MGFMAHRIFFLNAEGLGYDQDFCLPSSILEVKSVTQYGKFIFGRRLIIRPLEFELSDELTAIIVDLDICRHV